MSHYNEALNYMTVAFVLMIVLVVTLLYGNLTTFGILFAIDICALIAHMVMSHKRDGARPTSRSRQQIQDNATESEEAGEQ